MADLIAKIFPFRQINTNAPAFIINKLYRTTHGAIKSQDERARLEINDTSFIYGEITPEGFTTMLAQAKPLPGEIFYDLGSGTGKAVFCAALLYDWKKCVGIEFLPGLYEISQALLPGFLKMDEIQQHYPDKKFTIDFIQGDFLTIDFMDADIIFINATTFNPVLWGELEKKLESLKTGSRVIVSTKKLDAFHFEKIHQALHPMSWGDCTVSVYQKK